MPCMLCASQISEGCSKVQAGIHLFVEKPLSVKSAEEVARLAKELGKLQRERRLVIAVGYMLRYSPAIQVDILILIYLFFCLFHSNSMYVDWKEIALHCTCLATVGLKLAVPN